MTRTGTWSPGFCWTEYPPPDDATLAGMRSKSGLFVLLFPQGNGRARAYVCFRAGENFRLQGQQDLARFLELTTDAGAPAEFYADAQPAGPLATFSGAAVWVDRPFKNGIALIGDAAAVADPTWGQGPLHGLGQRQGTARPINKARRLE